MWERWRGIECDWGGVAFPPIGRWGDPDLATPDTPAPAWEVVKYLLVERLRDLAVALVLTLGVVGTEGVEAGTWTECEERGFSTPIRLSSTKISMSRLVTIFILQYFSASVSRIGVNPW